jgi:hypothetical protein
VNVRIKLTSTLAASVYYLQYHQRYSNPETLPTGFPAQYNRNSFAVGLSFWGRLAGLFPANPRMPGDW